MSLDLKLLEIYNLKSRIAELNLQLYQCKTQLETLTEEVCAIAETEDTLGKPQIVEGHFAATVSTFWFGLSAEDRIKFFQLNPHVIEFQRQERAAA